MRHLFLVIFLFSVLIVNAQSFTAGFLPDINLSYKVGEDYKIIHKIESRYPSFNDEDNKFKINFERLDFQNFVERKVALFSKLAVGYQFRINNSESSEHRFIQQFSWTDNLFNYRIGHRFRTDQTYSQSFSPEFRFRYRAEFQLPLQGRELDQGEFYLSISDEALSSIQSSDWDFDNRVVVKLGLYKNDNNKVESGFDWRAEGFLFDTTEHQIWLALSWYKTL
jgi:hypothetical protein